MTDIAIELGGFVVNLRVAAILSCEDRVLVFEERTGNWYYLPGGRIKAGETSKEALERELREELGDGFEIRRPIVCAENFFGLAGHRFHEFCTFYEVDWLGELPTSQREGTGEAMLWVPRTEVMSVDVRPALIKEFIHHPRSHLELVLNREYSWW